MNVAMHPAIKRVAEAAAWAESLGFILRPVDQNPGWYVVKVADSDHGAVKFAGTETLDLDGFAIRIEAVEDFLSSQEHKKMEEFYGPGPICPICDMQFEPGDILPGCKTRCDFAPEV